ncbi:MAG: hypothetical protein ACN6O1_10385 [Comamonas sp.]|uniref:hypothetical protein n=1 Tax=Comamonas sp. TaxID=34028 RepID=UPI003D0A815F
MTFPYTGWVLMPSYKPKPEQFVKSFRATHHVTDKGKYVHLSEIYVSMTQAINAGTKHLSEQQAALDKKQANINKRRAALEKAAGEAKP